MTKAEYKQKVMEMIKEKVDKCTVKQLKYLLAQFA